MREIASLPQNRARERLLSLLGKQLLILVSLVVLRESPFPSARQPSCPDIVPRLWGAQEQNLPWVQQSFPGSRCALDPCSGSTAASFVL